MSSNVEKIPPAGLSQVELSSCSSRGSSPGLNCAIDLATPRIVSLLQWLHARLFSIWSSSLASLGILYPSWMLIPPLIDWAFVREGWSPENASLCRDAIGRSDDQGFPH
jgi:hypothetical protein